MASLWLLLLLTTPQADLDLIAKRNFLDRSQTLQKAIIANPTPENIANFTVFLTEYYAKQITFRTFLMRNLLPGEHLIQIRNNQSDLTNDERQQIIEKNLHQLIQKAMSDHPHDLYVNFAQAQMLYAGLCCHAEKPNDQYIKQAIKVFEAAHKEGITSPTSLYALALNELEQNEPNREKSLAYLQQAHQRNPFNVNYVSALINEELHHKNSKRALQLSRILFEMAATSEDKIASFIYSARSFIQLEDYENAMNFINAGLKAQPRNPFLWYLGLDSLRNSNGKSSYFDHINKLLNQDPYNPMLFKTFTDYLTARGVHEWDIEFIQQYQLEQPSNDEQRFFKHFNLAMFYHLSKQYNLAQEQIKSALQYKGKLSSQSESYLKLLTQLQGSMAR